MVYKRYIKRGGKSFGPYYYESYRDFNGKIHTRYLKDYKPKKKSFLFVLILCSVIIFLGFFSYFYFLEQDLFSENINYFSNDFNKVIDSISESVSFFSTGFSIDNSTDFDRDSKDLDSSDSEQNKFSGKFEDSENLNNLPEENEESEINEKNETNETPEDIEENSSQEIVNNSKNFNESNNFSEDFNTNTSLSLTNKTILENQTFENKTNVSEDFENDLSEKNITEENLTNVSQKLVLSESVQNSKIVIENPVKWVKMVNVSGSGNLSLELPKKAENITLKTGKKAKKSLKELENYNFEIEKKTKKDSRASGITGFVVFENKDINLYGKIIDWFSNLVISGKVIDVENLDNKVIELDDKKIIELQENIEDEEISLEYFTESPQAIEENIVNGKRIIISGPDELNYTDILAYTFLEKEVKEEKINFYHIVDGERIKINFEAYDDNENGLIDYIEWNVEHLSNQTYELEIVVLNVQSYPVVGGNWTVIFNTTGEANLKISAINETTFGDSLPDDLKFLELKCGENIIETSWVDESIFVENYSCDETSYEISKVLTSGKHDLEFDFGGQIAYAHNDADGDIYFEKNDSGMTASGVSSYTDWFELTETFENGTYLIFFQDMQKTGSCSGYTNTQFLVDGNVVGSHGEDSLGFSRPTTIYVADLNGETTLKTQYKAWSSWCSSTFKNGKIVAIKVSSDSDKLQYDVNNDDSSPTKLAWTTSSTVTINPGSTGKYAVFASGGGSRIKYRLDVGGTEHNEIGPQNGDDYFAMVITELSSETTINLDYYAENYWNSRMYDSSLVVVRLDDQFDYGYVDNSTSRALEDGEGAFDTKDAILEFTPSNTRNYVFLGSGTAADGNFKSKWEVDGTETDISEISSSSSSDVEDIGVLDIVSLTSGVSTSLKEINDQIHGNVSYLIFRPGSGGSSNTAPDSPNLNSPSDDASGQSTNPLLNVTISDADGDAMNVTFYNDSDDSVICENNTNIANDTDVLCTWSGLSGSTDYSWYVNVTDGEDTIQSSTWNFSTIVENNAPTTPSPIINSVNGNNYTNETINCSATISDDDSDDLNVSVRWYKNGELNLTQDFNNSYSSGIIFNSTLLSGNTTAGENWSCSMQLNDGEDSSDWGSSENITILEDPDLEAPTFDSGSPFNMSVYSSDGNVIQQINASDNVGVECFSVNDTDFEINCSGYFSNSTVLSSGVYWINVTVNDSAGNENSSVFYVRVITLGTLNVTLVSPTGGPNNQPQNQFFNLRANVSCQGETGATCGIVNGTARYNDSSANPDTAIQGDDSSTIPFYTIEPNPQSCGELNVGDSDCNLTWQVNATGEIEDVYELDVLFSSNESISSNNTNNFSIKIISPILSVILSDDLTSVNFGNSLVPGTEDNPALNNSANAYNITCQHAGANCNISIKGNDDLKDGAKSLGIGNVSWNKINDNSTENLLSTNYNVLNSTLPDSLTQLLFFWLDVPSNTIAGDYQGNFTIYAESN